MGTKTLYLEDEKFTDCVATLFRKIPNLLSEKFWGLLNKQFEIIE